MTISTEKLEVERAELMKALSNTAPFIQGSLYKVKVKCGKSECRCASGEKHEAFVLSKKVGGKTVTMHVPRYLYDEVKAWVEENKKLKKLIKEISNLNEQIIRSRIKGQRKGRKDIKE